MRFLLLFIIFLYAFSIEVKVANYNVENLFDLKYDKTEYKEFHPGKKWNKRIVEKKLRHIARVLNDIDADIVALEEVESIFALDMLLKKLPKYKYNVFLKNKHSSIGVALISKYPILKQKRIDIKSRSKYKRPILEADINIKGRVLKIFVNHWRSKRASESRRIPYAKALMDRIKQVQNKDYIIIGDLNSDYNEFITFKKTKLNDTRGITAINHILNTIVNNKFVTKKDILKYNKIVHYNLWLELPPLKRFSHKFGAKLGTLDNIILPKTMFDNKGFNYKNNSFNVFRPSYLYKNGKVLSWKKYQGYSDHLAIYATFTTQKQDYSSINDSDIIDELYNHRKIYYSFLKDVAVIYKYKKNTILAQNGTKAILIKTKKLKLGYSYDLVITKKKKFKIKKYTKKSKVNIDKYYINNLVPFHMVKDIKGLFKNRFLYVDNKKIKLQKKFFIPNKSYITIKKGFLTEKKGKLKLEVFSEKDIIIND